MIAYDLDPGLQAQPPEVAMLDDGFSPPHHDIDADEARKALAREIVVRPEEDIGLGPKSLF